MQSAQDGGIREDFEFTGSGSEYFGIWIVNLLLTVLTLGIYSAWAKVRRLKYFYQHTRLAGGGFDYHGDPIAILKGRVIAFALFLLYSLGTSVPGPLALLSLLLLGALLPWLMRNAFRFRLRNSSYRGLRFSFRGSTADAYLVFAGYGALMLLSLGLLAPLFHQRMKAYQHGHSWFGKTSFAFTASVGAFYRAYLLVGLVLTAGLVVGLLGLSPQLLSLMQSAQTGGPPDPVALSALITGITVLMILLYLAVGPLFQARIGNLVWNGTQLGAHRFDSRLRARRLLWIQLSNFVLIALTLGLFLPWAAVRLARYRAQCLSLIAADALEGFVAEAQADPAALGEEAVDMFDFDIGL